MFDKEFYPTPVEVLELMDIDCNNKIVLEPSAGKGDIVDYLKSHRAKEVYAYEKNDDLRRIASSKCTVLGSDFFTCTSEDVSHIDMIVMNPPFSNAHEHIIHAFNICPEGCEIIALCNYETIEKGYRYRNLSSIIGNYGDYTNLGNCFKEAERKTNVEVGLIKLFKPVVTDNEKFEGFFIEPDEEEGKGDGLIQYNEIRSIVNRYVQAIKSFDKLAAIKDDIDSVTSDFGFSGISFKVAYNDEFTTRREFSKRLQKSCWKYVFKKMNLSKYVTTGVMKSINEFVETQSKYPFTMKNIYRMIDIIIGTRQETLNRALEEVIDNFTKHTHENRFGVEGWKTNSGHMLNKKFIIDYIVREKYYSDKLELCYNGREKRMDDLLKVICNIRGHNYSDFSSLWEFFNKFEGVERNKWYSWGVFEFKVFKKGTMHIKFQNDKDWYYLNKAYGELKGFTLAEKYDSSEKSKKKKVSSSGPKKETKKETQNLSKQLFEFFKESA